MRPRALLLLAPVLACTAPIEAAPLDLDEVDHVPERLALPSWSVVAEVEAPPVGDRPSLELVPLDIREHAWLEPGDICPFTVASHGFPAVSADGGTIVTAEQIIAGNADIRDEHMELRWLGSDARVDTVYDRGSQESWEPGGCKRAREQLEARVAELDAALARRQWRPLERLDVHTFGSWIEEHYPNEEDIEPEPTELPASERPVELYFGNDRLIARVRGVKVLEMQRHPEWLREDEFCDRSPNISALWVDRHTRRAMVSFNYYNGGCLCDEQEYQAALMVSQALIDEVDRRPTRRGMSL